MSRISFDVITNLAMFSGEEVVWRRIDVMGKQGALTLPKPPHNPGYPDLLLFVAQFTSDPYRA